MPTESRTDEVSRSVRSLLLVAGLTPLLLVSHPGSFWESTPAEALVVVVAVGVLGGVGAEVLLRDSDVDPQGVSESVALAVALPSSLILTGLLWILLPYGLFQKAPLFSLGFAWGFSLATVARRVWLVVAG